MTADKLRVAAIFLGFDIVVYCIMFTICFFADSVDAMTIILIQQAILIVPLVIYELVGLICYLKRKRREEK